jgi:hypothetical protein
VAEMTEVISNLCKRYGFKFDFIGKYVKIVSKRDTWYFINRQYNTFDNIKLLHQNNYGGSGTHRQNRNFRSLKEVFAYIDGHDRKELTSRDKCSRIFDTLKVLYAK